MNSFTELYPILPRLEHISDDIEDILQPYLGWQLLETDDESGAILICKPCPATERRTRSQYLLILSAEVAEIWFQVREGELEAV